MVLLKDKTAFQLEVARSQRNILPLGTGGRVSQFYEIRNGPCLVDAEMPLPIPDITNDGLQLYFLVTLTSK